MTAERKTCPVTRDRLHPGRLITGCGGEVLETATKCPICGKPVETDPHQRLKDEYDALEASYLRLNRRWAELVTEVHQLRDFREAVENRAGTLHVVPEATMKRIERQLARRKREVQTLQEACRKHRTARREYAWDLRWRNDQIGAQNKVLADLQTETEFRVVEAWRKAPEGLEGARLECEACGGPFDWTGFVSPARCPHCGRRAASVLDLLKGTSAKRYAPPTLEPEGDQTGGEDL